MEESDIKYIDRLIKNTEESIHFFSNKKKTDRERCVCAALLRCIGVTFFSDQIQANNNDPPDVLFKSANFEVIELYDKGRKRHDEYKTRLEILHKASSINDTLVHIHQRTPITYQELNNEVSRALKIKSKKYGKKLCSNLDALVYVGLSNRFLDIKSPLPEYNNLISQGWRSVSFVMPPFSHIVFCKEKEPDFLVSVAGRTKQKWKYPDGFFDL